jgi:hypothetical protein
VVRWGRWEVYRCNEEVKKAYPEMPRTTEGSGVPSLTMNQFLLSALNNASSRYNCSSIGYLDSLNRCTNGFDFINSISGIQISGVSSHNDIVVVSKAVDH